MELIKKEQIELEVQKELSAKMQPIPNLKVGDVVRYRGNGGYKVPENGAICVVYSLIPDVKPVLTGSRVEREDFTVLVDRDDNIIEYQMDSRYFERIE